MSFITSIIGPWLPQISIAVVALLAFFGIRKSGANRLKVKTAKDKAKRIDAGRKKVAQAKGKLADGKAPAEIVKDNDDAWD